MEHQIGFFNVRLNEGQSCVLKSTRRYGDIVKYDFLFRWSAENAADDDVFTVCWAAKVPGVMYKWDSRCNLSRDLCPHWDDRFNSMLSRNSPVTCYFDGKDTNRYCWAVSECKKLVSLKNSLRDQVGELNLCFSFGTRQFTNRFETEITLYIDTRPVPMRRAVEDVAAWWENELGIASLQVPDLAREPIYSFWYSYHQNVNARDVEQVCRKVKDMGFDICIVDDGWQTDDASGGYAFCGDWRPAPGKFSDMAEHIRRVHEIGMKYILWYAVPLIGPESVNFSRFEDKLLCKSSNGSSSILDPRYSEIRSFLVDTFKKAMTEWNPDGFKLDFIDSWSDSPDNMPYNEKMDIPDLQDAVDKCMSDIVGAIAQIKPDILLEFRMSYIGPHMRRFGNIFRVGDCAGDYLRNRASILDLRMLMGESAVHSDMLMMAPFEDPRINAIQIISCMFGSMQFSGRPDSLNEDTIRMSRFWLSFFKEHRALLQSRTLKTYEAHLLYTWAQTTLDGECAAGVFAVDKVIKLEPAEKTYIANGCMGERIFLEMQGTYNVRVFDCFGNTADSFEKEISGVEQISVPAGGLVVMTRRDLLPS
ncbi:MAG: alpha-galactosidase [Clostridia bacterium]|nr:alpha-galactosidase [Clostridia bacterium]